MSESHEPIGAHTVRALRRHWKPTKQRLADSAAHEPLLIRIHRSCSWLARVEQLDEQSPPECAMIYRWIAVNALYGRWDAARREPQGDRATLPGFLDRMIELDANGSPGNRIPNVLEAHRKLVMAIYDDGYLNQGFWREPCLERLHKNRRLVFNARTMYLEKRYGGILHRLIDRIYLLRCQIVHGAATLGGQLNRTAVRRCSMMLGHLVPVLLLTIMDYGVDEDWGGLCYPPQ